MNFKKYKINNADLIKKFYEAFSCADAEGMVDCYASNIEFMDPAFGTLKGEDAKNMWRMLISRSQGGLKITYDTVKADHKNGSVNWKAVYLYGAEKREVINIISAKFEFENGKIIKHYDHFDLWKWSRQALGWKGYLLGWTPFMRKSIQKTTNTLLRAYNKKK